MSKALSEEIRRDLEKIQNGTLDVLLSVVHTLRKAQCCFRCCLRFVNYPNLNIYAHNEKDLKEAFDQLLQDHNTVVNVCTACVGSLQHADDPVFINGIGEAIMKENYDTKQVNLNCTLPVSLFHRNHLLEVYLRSELNYACRTRDAKEPFRYIISELIRTKWNIVNNPSSPLRMTIILEHDTTAMEHLFLTQTENQLLKVRKKRKKGVESLIGDSRQTIIESLKQLEDNEARSLTTVPPLPPADIPRLSAVQLVHESTIVGGRYLKLSREYSQTPWEVKGKKLSEFSVSESICEVLKKHHRADAYKFVPAGREDANVRMLGTGRPFYCELVNPRTPLLTSEEYKRIQDEINALPSKNAVQLKDLTKLDSSCMLIIKQGEQFKRKKYRALVWLSEPVTDEIIDRVNQAGSSSFYIKQNTPIRVFQRRSAAIREKEIVSCRIERPSGNGTESVDIQHLAVLTMNTQAGTYIKEFVHGDLGRTVPNLATLAGVSAADLLELDVMHVDLEWPPLADL